MLVFWVLAMPAVLLFVLDRVSATPRARAVPVSRRLAEARRIADGDDSD